MAMPPIPLTSNANLSHHRGGYVIVKCCACGHRRDIRTEALARIFGWDRKVRLLAARFRCSNCGQKQVDISFGYDRKPRGGTKNPS
jgi:ribosomal protein S27E